MINHESRAQSQGPAILVVEDDLALQTMLVDLLEGEGYRTQSATSGAQALEQLGQTTPHLVLLDLHLPDMDGYTVCQRIRADFSRHVPIVMLTAHRDSRGALQAFHVGADDYVRKPFSIDELLVQIRAHLAAPTGVLTASA